MLDTRKEIERRLLVLRGLDLSDVNRAANMLTLGFGPLREAKNFKGVLKHVGQWALHVQCAWRLERAGNTVATQQDLCGSDKEACATADRLRELLVQNGPTVVEAVSASEAGGLELALSGGLCLVIVPDRIEGSEDWRFFARGVDAAHFVIEGGKVDPASLA
ncbi:hypothetical protein B0G80_1831 [Paraburkholderia sp. BL6669N2]|uniref:hypothetical protein n=1 Tax=Paraburkholderia sp. BL6669N2 TaxID=1938807 RepID=UPI000E2426CC|nr:hypothetical protein [Paraburkholderia sp. BL6669N2]REG59105.1 hypothetical protein B0G80_1831 [Paraburkholderia sp. BL6669N2]